jgi:XTP/dITP diphosphohydrolase
MPGSTEVWFATSNQHKFEEAELILNDFNFTLKRLPAKGVEVQSDSVFAIAKQAAKAAYAKWKRPLFVEDTGLFVKSLNGFPGPYASYVAATVGPSSLLKLIKGNAVRGAEFVTAVAFCNDGSYVRLFAGSLKGCVSRRPKGTGGFGFDPIFIPEGETRTLAEMSPDEKSAVSHRSIALKSFGRWFERSQLG